MIFKCTQELVLVTFHSHSALMNRQKLQLAMYKKLRWEKLTKRNGTGWGGKSCDKLTKRSGTGVELFQQSSLCATCWGIFCDFQVEEGHAIQHLTFTTGQRTQHVKNNSHHHLPQAEERNAVHGIKLMMVIQTQKGWKEHLFQNGHTVCKFSGKSPSSSHKMTLKQQINGQKWRKMKEKDLFWFSFCSLFGVWKIVSLMPTIFQTLNKL